MNKNPNADHLRPLNQIDSRLESIDCQKHKKDLSLFMPKAYINLRI